MAEEKVSGRQKRRYGQSCEVCRRQKKRCEGRDDNGKSLCLYCAKHGLECTFPASGEKSKLEAAISRGDVLEHFVKELVAAPVEHRDARLAAFARDRVSNLPPRSPNPTSSPPKKRRTSYQTSPGVTQYSWASASGSTPGEDDFPPIVPTPSGVDDFQTFPGSAGLLALADMASEPSMGMQGSTLPRWLDYCIQTLDKAGLAAGFDPGQIDLMLESFFSFHNPRFRFVDRHLFGRSVQNGDRRFCSPFLLASILAFTLKYAPSWQHRMEELGARAHMLLAQELAEPVKLTTVQGLLILCNYHANLRRKALCSQYLRLAAALLEAYPDFNAPLQNDEQCLYAHLQWTIYSMTAYMNISFINEIRGVVRKPKRELPDSVSFAADSEMWKPVWLPGEARGTSPVSVQPSYEHSTFVQNCKFYVILEDILNQVQLNRDEGRSTSSHVLADLTERLKTAEAAVPTKLLIDCKACPWPCPPVHVLFFNVLIRVCWLLLYSPRPGGIGGVVASDSEDKLRGHAADVQTLFSIGYAHYPSRLSFLFIYAVFSGAAIDLERLKVMRSNGIENDPEREVIGHRLNHTLDALHACRNHILGIETSVNLLKKHRDAALGDHLSNLATSGMGVPPAFQQVVPEVTVPHLVNPNEGINWLLEWSQGQIDITPAMTPSMLTNGHSEMLPAESNPVTNGADGHTSAVHLDGFGDVGMDADSEDPLANYLRELVGEQIPPEISVI